jgi:type IV secretion system protein VirD4
MDPSAIGLLGAGVLGLLGYFWHAHASAGGVRRGFASAMDIVENLSPAHARRAALQTRPETRVSWWTPVRAVGIDLGRTLGPIHRQLVATLEDVILYVAAPRTGKTGSLARHVQDAVGAVLATSTKADLWKRTRWSRRLRPVWVFNPRGVGVIPGTADPGPVSNLRWSPVLASVDIYWTWLIAAIHVSVGETGGQKEAEYWEAMATRALRLLLAAAHVGGVDMHEVYAWIGSLAAPGALDRAIAMLNSSQGRATFPDWGADLSDLSRTHPKTLGSISSTLLNCVGYMADPDLAHAATPGPGEHFDPPHCLLTGGTVYVIGEHEEHSPVGPLFSTFIGVFYAYARAQAGAKTSGRLDPPLTLVLDEATNTFRVPLARWTSDAGSHGIPVIIAVQGRYQLREAFGENEAAIIWQNATTKITYGGQSDPDTLRDLSVMCDERAAEVGTKVRVPVMRPGEIRQLPPRVALILHRGVRPVLARIPMVWERKNPPVAEPLAHDDRPGAEIVRLDDRRPDKVA